MSSTYGGNSANNPALLTFPTDGDKLRAATFRPGLEGLADRTAYNTAQHDDLRALTLPMRAVNWPTKVTSPVGTDKCAHYWRDRWYILGTSESVAYSLNRGVTWTTDTALQGVLSGEHLTWMTSTYFSTLQPIGLDGGLSRILVATDNASGKVAYYNGSAWSLVTLPGSLTLEASPDPRVVYDPIHNKWVWIGPLSAGIMWSATASDPSTTGGWTGGGFGGTEWNDGGPHTLARMAVRADTGRIIAVCFDDSTTEYQFIVSDDGGTTWADLASVAATLGGDPNRASLIFNEHDESWICMFSRSTDLTGQLLRSTDNGATWTVMCTFTAASLGDVACFEGLLVSTALVAGAENYITYSIDDGATWRRAYPLDSTAIGAFAGAGQPLVLSVDSTYAGLVAGSPPALAVG